MSDTVVTTMGFSRANLNQDVARAVEGQGKLNYVAILNSCFPARSLTPSEFAASHLTPRKVHFMYLGAQDEVPLKLPRGYDMLVVMGIGFTRRETEDVTETINNAQTAPGIIVGIPLQPLVGSAQLREIAALDSLANIAPYDRPGSAQEMLQTRRSMLLRQAIERFRRSLAPDNYRWLQQGQLIEEAPVGSRRSFFSDVLESVFSASPKMHSPGSREERWQAVAELLDLANPLQVSAHAKKGSMRVIRQMLVESQVLRVEKDCGSYLGCKVGGFINSKEAVALLWNELLVSIIGSGEAQHKVRLHQLIDKFSRAPYGLDRSHLAVFLAAALRRYGASLTLSLSGGPLSLSGVALRQAMNSAAKCEIVYTPAASSEAAMLRGILGLFPVVAGSAYADADLWGKAAHALCDWQKALPNLVTASAHQFSKGAEVLKNVTDEEYALLDNARDFFTFTLPEAFGEGGIPLEEQLPAYLEKLSAAKAELEDYAALRRQQTAAAIGRLFTEEATCPAQAPAAWLEEIFNRWYERLFPYTDRQPVSDWGRALMQFHSLEGDLEEKWFVKLPVGFNLPAVNEWETDLSPILNARLVRARLELELWHVRRLFPLPEGPDERRTAISHWMRKVMEGTNIKPEERESMLLDLLEHFCWS